MTSAELETRLARFVEHHVLHGERLPVTSLCADRPDLAVALQTLVDRYQSEAGVRTVVGSLPVTVTFPSYGPVVFLASELTAEGRAPSVDLDVKRSIHP